MRSIKPVILIAILAIAAFLLNRHPATAPQPSAASGAAQTIAPDARQASALPSYLPPEARDTVALILRGGPYAHRQDGTVFGNREGRLPAQANGYYHEYTVETPGLDYRGARRIITGGNPPAIFYYTDDHYRTFRSFQVTR